MPGTEARPTTGRGCSGTPPGVVSAAGSAASPPGIAGPAGIGDPPGGTTVPPASTGGIVGTGPSPVASPEIHDGTRFLRPGFAGPAGGTDRRGPALPPGRGSTTG